MSKPPSLNEIRASAAEFAARWSDETDENAGAQSFWNEFLGMFGIDRKRVGVFEKRAERASTGGRGRIDLFWPGVLAVEHKSAGKDLAAAERQCLDYLEGLPQAELPQAIITSDFARLRILDLTGDRVPVEISTKDLAKEVERFGFITGYGTKRLGVKESEVDAHAAELMGLLYEEIADSGFTDHEASVFLTRMLFLFFGDDTGLWERNLLLEFIETRTHEDGSDLGPQLAMLFQTLDRPADRRSPALDEVLLRFPYVNGGLFADRLDIPAFNATIRRQLIECCIVDWAAIVPAIFGSMFQAVKSKEARRALGEHYTSEANILKVAGPLFLDELHAEMEAGWHDVKRLRRLRERLGRMKFLDPACGCGNFLAITYRDMRALELSIMRRLRDLTGESQLSLDPTLGLTVSPAQFHGIEVEEWPARIAEVAMFLVDHQANLRLAEEFGQAPDRLPITTNSKIVQANALHVDWAEVVGGFDSDTYIMGNPPFLGPAWQTADQASDQQKVWGGTKGSGSVDFVTNWLLIGARMVSKFGCHAAFVATNSVTQGQQPAILWGELNKLDVCIPFAWRTFVWQNAASGQAAVHCVIVGLARRPVTRRRMWDSYGIETRPGNINAYLLDAEDILITSRSRALSPAAPFVTTGGKPVDGGFLSNLSPAEAAEIRAADPLAAKYLRRIYGAQELINGVERWCLWLVGADVNDVRSSTVLRERVAGVRAARLASTKPMTRRDADRPTEFQEVRIPTKPYLAIPEVSSQSRRYIPAMYLSERDVPTNKIQVAEATLAHFGVVCSSVFTVWVESISGRLKSDFSISATVTLNTFPWQVLSAADEERITAAAQGVLDARAEHPESTLADLYDPLAMPANLLAAHRQLDRAVLDAYGLPRDSAPADVLAHLFTLYRDLSTAGQMDLDAAGAKPKRTRRKAQ